MKFFIATYPIPRGIAFSVTEDPEDILSLFLQYGKGNVQIKKFKDEPERPRTVQEVKALLKESGALAASKEAE